MAVTLNEAHVVKLFNAGVLGVSDTAWLVMQGYYLIVYAGKVKGVGCDEAKVDAV